MTEPRSTMSPEAMRAQLADNERTMRDQQESNARLRAENAGLRERVESLECSLAKFRRDVECIRARYAALSAQPVPAPPQAPMACRFERFTGEAS